MSADDQVTPAPPASGPRIPKLSRDDSDALTWLGKWIGIPLLLVFAIYYSEYLWNAPVQVPTVTRQEVRPYPFPDGAAAPTLAPPRFRGCRRRPSCRWCRRRRRHRRRS